MTTIQPPTTCPSCGSLLDEVNYLLYCRNEHCGDKLLKLIEHFAKTLKIKGLGPATIKKLQLKSINDIYWLTVEDLKKKLDSKILALKLFNEIQNSRNAPLNVLLPAFSIPLIGKTATEKLATEFTSIEEIYYEKCRKAGLGEKAATNLTDWLQSDFYDLCTLPFSWNFEKNQQTTTHGVVCISGKLTSFKNKAEAQNKLEELGYVVKASLTKDVTILVNESGIESAKTIKARDSGVQIITNLLDFIGEKYGTS